MQNKYEPVADIKRDEFGQSLYDDLQALPANQRMSSGQLEVVYALAYAHIVQHQYEQALPIFSFLCLYGPTRKHYLVGLALCLQMCERYDDAMDIYALILTLYPEHHDAALRTAECQIATSQLEQAHRTLTLLEQIGRADSAHAPWLARVMTLQKLFKETDT